MKRVPLAAQLVIAVAAGVVTGAVAGARAEWLGEVAVLFSAPGPEHAPSRATTALLLVSVQAPGVDDLFVEEAVWTAADALAG